MFRPPLFYQKSNKFHNNVGINCYPHFTSYILHLQLLYVLASTKSSEINEVINKLASTLYYNFLFGNFLMKYPFIYRYTWSIIYVVCINCVFIHTYDGLININSTSRNNCKHKECVGKLCFMINIWHLTTAVVHWWKPSSSNNFWNDWNIDIILVIF